MISIPKEHVICDCRYCIHNPVIQKLGEPKRKVICEVSFERLSTGDLADCVLEHYCPYYKKRDGAWYQERRKK